MLAPALGPAIAGLGAEREPSRCSDLLLLYHAIELYLKALLRSDGRDLKSIKDLSLRITKAGEGAQNAWLRLSHDDVELLRLIDSYDNVVRTRYVPTGAHSRPEEQALGDFCQYLDESVGDHLAASGYPIRVKHSFSQPTAPTSVTDHVSEDIETLSSKEREILAYLLHHNQCLFTCAADGGHAATLTSRAIVHRALKQGQIFDYLDMPVEIPIEVWRFLRENVEKSPCEGAEDEPHPWRRKHWME